MKKLLFSAVTLDVGGIETALVTLVNYLASQKENNEYKYEITLVLEKKQGLFLDVLDQNIKVVEYTPNNNKIVLIRKALNFLKQQHFKKKYGNKYDFSCSYATYSNPASFVARTASTNSALWCHMDYLGMFEGNQEKVKQFFEEKHYKEFKQIVFVSQKSKDTFLQVFPEESNKTQYINNLIDYNKILKLSKEKQPTSTTEKKLQEEQSILAAESVEQGKQEILTCKDTELDENIVTFVNIGRHDEKQKKLSRIIDATKLLKDANKKFRIIFVGDGKDTESYKKLVKEYNLEQEIIFLGRKKNPYPYLKMADCVVLSSDYEGYPVVFVESMILNKPIITTDVSGVEAIQKEGYAIITEKNANSIYETMKKFIENGFNIENKFNPESYNNEIIAKLEKMF